MKKCIIGIMTLSMMFSLSFLTPQMSAFTGKEKPHKVILVDSPGF